jgi:hypothetical protein
VLYPVRDQHDDRFDCTQEAYGFRYREQDAVPVELAAGAPLIFNGYLLHRSLPNTARHGMRRALVNHYMSAESLLPWFAPAEPQAMGRLDHRDIELVAGEDRTRSRQPSPRSAAAPGPPAQSAVSCVGIDVEQLTRELKQDAAAHIARKGRCPTR